MRLVPAYFSFPRLRRYKSLGAKRLCLGFGYIPSMCVRAKSTGASSPTDAPFYYYSRRAPASLSPNTTIAIGNSICCQARGLTHCPVSRSCRRR